MRWFVRSRVKPAMLGVLLAAIAALALSVTFPSFSRTAEVPLRLFVPAVIAAALLAPLGGGMPHREAQALRPLGRLDSLCALVPGAVIALLICVAGLLVDIEYMASARNVLGYVGVGLILRRILGLSQGIGAMMLYAVLVSSIGNVYRPGVKYWPLGTPDNLVSLVSATSLLAVGLWIGTGRNLLSAAARRPDQLDD